MTNKNHKTLIIMDRITFQNSHVFLYSYQYISKVIISKTTNKLLMNAMKGNFTKSIYKKRNLLKTPIDTKLTENCPITNIKT